MKFLPYNKGGGIRPKTPKIKTKFSEPKCEECKYHEDGRCKLFKYSAVSLKYDTFHFYVDIETARLNDTLCGPDGKYFRRKNKLEEKIN